MPRKKISKPETRTGDSIEEAEPGDYCYYLNYNNKPAFAEIKKVFEESGMKVLHIMCQTDFKFFSVPASICSFEEKDLKGKKRAMLCPQIYGDKSARK